MGSSALASGSLFANRFEIDRPAGSGGIGTVYRARDRYSGEWVALKLWHLDKLGPDEVQRFTREVRILSELHHSGVVSYVSHGQAPDGQHFLCMEWLEGEALGERLSSGPLPIAEALALTRRLAETLAFTHRRGVLHRDLKPMNILLPAGDVSCAKIIDFGIARGTAVNAITRTGVLVGTPEYMAPEQARGVKELTPAADLFALGCILYHCLCGEPPFAASQLATVLVRILFEEPIPIAKRCPGIPSAVSALLNLMLAKDPAQRINDAARVAELVASIGEVPAQTLEPTLDISSQNSQGTGDSEQVLLSLVLVLASPGTEAGDAAGTPSRVLAALDQHGTLLAELRALGARTDILSGEALVVIMPQLSSAKDQAALAARCAAAIRASCPAAQVAVATGRGSREPGHLTGEALDRAWMLLDGLRSQGAAPSAQSLIDEVSAGLLETTFEVAPQSAAGGPLALGNERLVQDPGRLLLGKPTPCVGRGRELAFLESVLNECKEEALARAVLVLAPPGLGKSRLRHEFSRRLEGQGEPVRILMGRGDPLSAKSDYGILGDALRRTLHIGDGQDLGEKRARLRQLIGAHLPCADALRVSGFLGELCGLRFPDAEDPQLRAARQDPRLMIDQVEQAWLDGLRSLCMQGPLLLILEDLHWSDVLSVKLVESALRRLRDYPLMVLALARLEVQELFPNLWTGFVEPLPLHPISRKACERLVSQVLQPDAAASEGKRIVEQSAGSPLFLEEIACLASYATVYPNLGLFQAPNVHQC